VIQYGAVPSDVPRPNVLSEENHPTLDFGALATALRLGQRAGIPWILDGMTNDAICLLDALSIDRAHFAGVSMGGMIAQIAGSDHPEHSCHPPPSRPAPVILRFRNQSRMSWR